MKAESQATFAFDTIQLLFGIHATLLRGELSASRALEGGAAIDQYKIKGMHERAERLSAFGASSLETHVLDLAIADKKEAWKSTQVYETAPFSDFH